MLIGIVGCSACTPERPPESSGPRIASREALDPGKPPFEEGSINTAGTSVTVLIVPERKDSLLTLKLMRHGEVYDQETYQDLPGSFSLVLGAGERYDPPIPLLKFPMEIGQSWTWEGTSTALGEPAKASATITVTQEKTFVCGVPVESVQSQVDLTIGHKQRAMKFFFAKDRGLFGREFGPDSVREPGCDK